MFLYSQWRNLDLPTRIRIANDLGIKKVGPTHVRDNVVESDGYLIKDVESVLSTENLQKYLNTTESNSEVLWEWLTKGKPEVKLESIELEVKPTKNVKTKKSK